MRKLTLARCACLSAVLFSALGFSAIPAAPARAQEIGEENLFDEFQEGGQAGRARLAIDRFTLAGNGCPDRNSTSLMIEQRADVAELKIDFTRGDRPFQVRGPGEERSNCTVRVQLDPRSNRAQTVAISRVSEGVRFANRSTTGGLTIRSQFQLNNDVSSVRAFRLQNSLDTSTTNVVLEDFGVSTRVNRMLELRAILQLELDGQNDAVLRLDTLTVSLALGDGRGAADADPFVRRGNDRADDEEPVARNRRGEAAGDDDRDAAAERRRARGDDDDRGRIERRRAARDDDEDRGGRIERRRAGRGEDAPADDDAVNAAEVGDDAGFERDDDDSAAGRITRRIGDDDDRNPRERRRRR